MIWGGAFNSENFRAGFEAVAHRYREAGSALGFGRLGTFLNVTLPIGGRIALPSSINTYISVLKNTSLMYVIGYPELTTTALNISNLTLRDDRVADRARRHLPDARLGALGADPPARVAARAPGGPLMPTSGLVGAIGSVVLALVRRLRSPSSTWRAVQDSDWAEPVWRYILYEGLPGTLRVSAAAVVGSALIGITFGTLMTIKLLPLQALDPPLYRGLPRPADSRHRLHRLLRPALRLAEPRVRAR